MNKDLTVGKPSKVLWMFCLPLFLSMIFQQLYTIADSLIAGRFLGETAAASVANGYEITFIFVAFAFGCNIGCSVIVSKLFGEKRYKDLKTAVYTTLIAATVLCLILVSVGLSVVEKLFELIDTPASSLPDSITYIKIYLWGFPFVLYYYVATGIFSALGDSKTPLIFLICSSLANIGVDVLFVTVCKMGVDGVAWATFICQAIACVLALIVIFFRFKKLPHTGKSDIFSWKLLGQIALIALPSILQQTFISVGNVLIQKLINGYGDSVMAGYGAAIKLNNLFIASIVTVGNGLSNYTAQNIGAGKMERIPQGFKAGCIMACIICVPIVLTYFFAGKYIVSFFIKDANPDAINTGDVMLKVLSPFYFVIAIKLIADGILRGSKCMTRFMIATMIDLVGRVVMSYSLNPIMGQMGIWISIVIGWGIALVLSLIFYRFNKKTHPVVEPIPNNP